MRFNPAPSQYVYLALDDAYPTPRPIDGRPAGVYAFPVSELVDLVWRYAGVLRYELILESNVPLIDAETYDAAQLMVDLRKLRGLGVEVDHIMSRWERYKSAFRSSYLPFATLWYVVTHAPSPDDADEPVMWKRPETHDPVYATGLLNALGIEAVDDRTGIISGTGAEHHIVAFFAADAFRVVAAGLMSPETATLAGQPWMGDALRSMPSSIPAQWRPQLLAPILGCGKFGCVISTEDPAVVIKITTDDTEAEFAETYADAAKVTVRYLAVKRSDVHHHGLPVFLLWREAAENIGGLSNAASVAIQDQAEHGAHAYDLMADPDVPKSTLGRAIDEWLSACQRMALVPELQPLATGMIMAYRHLGVVFGDIHQMNVGEVIRDGHSRVVITDPGRIAVVR